MNQGQVETKQKTLELSSRKLRKQLNKSLSHNSLFFLFLKILFIFLCIMIPIVSHNIINLEYGAYLEHNGHHLEGRNYVVAAQAIGHCQPMVFFSCISITVISLNIMNFLRRSIDTKNRRNQPKHIIDSGIVYVILMAISISILLICVMEAYAYGVVTNYKSDTNDQLKHYITQYVVMMPIYIFFTGLGLYFEMILTECGINYWLMMLMGFFFLCTDVSLAAVFCLYTDLDPIVSVLTGTTISVVSKFIITSSLFFTKIANWKPWQVRPVWEQIKKIWSSSWILCTYMLMYSLMMVLQITFMSMIVTKSSNAYLMVDGNYLLIVSRIAVYNILNIIIVIPKSMSNALIIKYRNQKATAEDRLRSFEISRRYSIITIWLMFVVGMIIWAFSDQIVQALYGNIIWADEPVAPGYPVDYFGPNITYIDIVKDFFKKGLFVGIIAQFVINYSLYYRVIVYNMLYRDKRNFWFLMVAFGISYGVCLYLFGVYLQATFRGIVGFMLALLVYGILATIIIKVSAYRNKRKNFNEVLEKRYDDYLPQWWEIGAVNYYKKLKYYKKIIMSKHKVSYI